MIILGIETSCDETALSLLEMMDAGGGKTEIRILANITHSQAALHAEYGGVFPNLAKREHQKNLIPLFKKILEESGFELRITNYELRQNYSQILENLRIVLEREPELLKQFLEFIPTIEKPHIDAIAVTEGPGLEPALWVGINFARALSLVWDIPIIPTNHMEGHIFAALLRGKDVNHESRIMNHDKKTEQFIIHNSKSQTLHAERYTLHAPALPALSLLISGGHTELVLMERPLEYKILGRTRDDAVGEAFDKVARLLGLPYPGGPQISALADLARKSGANYELGIKNYELKLPRPMLKSDNYDFSFSGLKTAVLYLVKKLTETATSSVPPLQKEVSDSERTEDIPPFVKGVPRSAEVKCEYLEHCKTLNILSAKCERCTAPVRRGILKSLLIGMSAPFSKGRIESALTLELKSKIAREFEDAVTEIFVAKVTRAVDEFNIKTLILGGGVIANKEIRRAMTELTATHGNLELFIPQVDHATDNALMIAVAGYFHFAEKTKTSTVPQQILANGNLSLSS